MAPHPEGGFFATAYVSDGVIPGGSVSGFAGDRSFSTAIYYLLRGGEKSYLHKLRQDEVWHFYKGDSMRMVMVSPLGELSKAVLGNDIASGETPQRAVRGGTWFGAVSCGNAGYSLAGCTVAPGFDFEDFELASADEMRKLFPSRDIGEIISEFCAPLRY
jgi:predicted cupin superfamily sugar epimerase